MQPSESQVATLPPIPAEFTAARRLPSGAVRNLCGNIGHTTLWRWVNRPELGFPQPFKVGSRNFWNEAEVLSWLTKREVAA